MKWFLIAAGVFVGSLESAVAVPDRLWEFFDGYCVECHDSEVAKGDFELGFLKISASAEDAEYWQLVLDNLHLGEMPPEDEKQPSAAEVAPVVEWIEAELRRARRELAGHGDEVVLRRLNRFEYENTIEDLFGVRGDFAAAFPEDAVVEGFDHIGAALQLSAEQVDQYLEAAEEVLKRAIETGERPETKSARFTLREVRVRADAKKAQVAAKKKAEGYVPTEVERKREEEARKSGKYGAPYFVPYGDDDLIAVKATKIATNEDFRVRVPGWYRFKVTAYAVRNEEEPVHLQVRAAYGDKNLVGRVVDVIQLTDAVARDYEYRIYLQPNQRVELAMLDGTNWIQGSLIEGLDDVAVAVRGIEIEGPMVEEWPPRGHRVLLGERDAEALEDGEMGEIFGDLAPRLFRRPVADSVVGEFVDFYERVRGDGLDELKAFTLTVKAMMASPHFVYHLEASGELDDYALANRLSYFLWRSMPDEELFALAAGGKLRGNAAVLREQVERMLGDAKAERFVSDFAGQWLETKKVGEMRPDKYLYPEYDEQLERAMVEETEGFLREMIASDLPVRDLIDSDWAMLNDRMAEHYGIPGVEGNRFRKVALDKSETVRGGLMTQASILNVTSNGTTTSPVVRGVFILEKILGNPPPPPPPDVPAIEPDIRGASTIQEQMEKHREIEQCSACHKKIDPYGMALENFDVIGGWREQYRALVPSANPNRPRMVKAKEVSSADKLARMGEFEDFREFRALMLEEEGRVYHNLAEKLSVYALGRTLGYADEEELEGIVEKVREGGGMRAMIHAVVGSGLFGKP